ncbi:type II toxin-antitoxin system HipA family toxin [Mariprofundus sp. EBB-1]|uniref:type II toxin-antitoxin system HipA family toxin n=1 Tax=Mariprofundus sp. EBB-1 TaxID=2650971 RepID=UPI000EF18D44|nr:type II toxin-antitoxin system HipA family toxin [Mariprofundus sp. EBB-1]RLL52737.1 type II toxin-antitoxin system HipA family toxin [Mariprofundus sp. EBB-1]
MVEIKGRRKKNQKSLNVWMNGVLVGTWTVFKTKPQKFQYASQWLEHPSRRILSLSMPFRPQNLPYEGDVVESFFDNLLPDSDKIRKRIQQKFAVRNSSPFELLAEVGRDCVGAIQLLAEGALPDGWDTIKAKPLSEMEVEKQLKIASSDTFLREDAETFRISIAGAQEKTALLWHDNQWCLPLAQTPTTHIMKLPLGLVGNMDADMSTSVENEWLCSKIMAAYGIDIAHCDMDTFGETKVLIVKRFDRKLSKGGAYWLRLPQEDMCQASGKPPSLKYENDGGPGMTEVLTLLRGSSVSNQDRRSFFKTQLIFWMLAATDGHAKNFSLFHEVSGTYKMTPIYDVLSTWPIMGEKPNHLSWHDAKLAMAFRSNSNTHYKLKDVYPRHFRAAAAKLGLAGQIDSIIEDILLATPTVIRDVGAMLPEQFPLRVAETIFAGLEESAVKIQRAESATRRENQ